MANLTPYQLKALNHSKHISLTANAGSGKTFVLARRFLSILITEDISLSNVVAITFTEKAAAELYKKIADELDVRINKSEISNERRKLIKIRRQLVSAKISTIHSFCADLLKEFSPEAGIDANFTPIDQNLSDELIINTIEELTNELIKNQNELWGDYKKTIRLFGSRDTVSKHLKKMVDSRSIVMKLSESLYSENIKGITQFFNKTFIDYYDQIFADKTAQVFDKIKKLNNQILKGSKKSEIAEEVEEIFNNKIDQDVFSLILRLNAIFKCILSDGKIRTRNYLNKTIREEYLEEVESIEQSAQEIKPFDFTDEYKRTELDLANISRSLLNIWSEILNRYEDKKRQLGYLDFEDLLLVTKDLLESKDVLSALSERYKYFMIDEYQDTNETQYNIFLPILDYLKRGNLFIVGDEKQSIYMFRGADLEIFNKTKQDILNSSEEQSLLRLPHSFRLSPELTLFTNKIFSNLFKELNLLFNEVEYDELVCARKEGENSKLELMVSDKTDASSLDESEMIARKIIEITKNEALDFRDIAILSRKRKSFAKIENSLIQYQIPYLMYGGKGFYQRQEIYDIYNYLSFLVNSSNDAALIGILRSPIFNLSDLELFEISNIDGEKYFEKLKRIASDNPKYYKIVDLLKSHINLSKTSQISFLIHQIITDTGYLTILSSKSNSDQYILNIEKLITSSNQFVAQGLKTLFDFVNYLEDAISSTEDESQASLLSNENAIKIMTIHASKGLEFPVVFLMDTNSRGVDDKVKSKDLVIDKKFGLLAKTPLKGNYFNDYLSAPIVCMHNYISQKKALAELKRLLYVGVTRAQNSLYISAEIKRKKTGEFTLEKTSLLALIMKGLQIDDFGSDFVIEGSVKFMIENEGKYITKTQNLSVPLSIQKELILEEKSFKKVESKEFINFKISSSEIEDTIKHEIISATKIAVFHQCPFKYYLIYELGYSDLHSITSNSLPIDVSREDSDEIAANIKGTIVHKILEEETPLTQLEARIDQLLVKNRHYVGDEEKEIKDKSIYLMLHNFFNSKIYEEIRSFVNFKNEFEIYSKVRDYFIYGIIDKVVFDEKIVRIYDYKTDSLLNSSVDNKMDNYKSQLIFYALLISKLYKEVEEIECNLIILEDLSKVPKINLTKSDLKKFEDRLSETVQTIRNEKFNKNTSHCKSCYFSDSNFQCVAENII